MATVDPKPIAAVKEPHLVILAAGMGSRYGGTKQLDVLGPNGETLIDYTLYDAVQAGFSRIVFVTRRAIKDEVRRSIVDRLPSSIHVDLVMQELEDLPGNVSPPASRTKPWGTGHALLAAAPAITGPFGVINADDYYGRASFEMLYSHLQSYHADKPFPGVLVGFKLQNTLSDYGSVSRAVCDADESGFLLDMVERTDIRKSATGIEFREENGEWSEISGNELVSLNMFGLGPEVLTCFEDQFVEFLEHHGDDPSAEFYLPGVLNQLIHSGMLKIATVQSEASWFGLTYSEDWDGARTRIRAMIHRGLFPPILWE